jgi:hypothetical protein
MAYKPKQNRLRQPPQTQITSKQPVQNLKQDAKVKRIASPLTHKIMLKVRPMLKTCCAFFLEI